MLPLLFLFSHTFQFPGIPVDMGVRQIHSPEHFGYGGLVQVLESEPPQRVGNYTCVRFTARTLLGDAKVNMLTDRSDTSFIIAHHRGVPVCSARLRATSRGVGAHAITLRGQVHGEMGVLGRVALGIVRHKSAWESAIRWGYSTKTEDENLRMYRERVLWD